tara:strand:- start:123 stop:647 length:525 start_codon:yes stop_codon:yes gene_type:complete
MSVQKQRTLGIIGGMSWESTESYYRLINEGIKGIKAKLGKLHSADATAKVIKKQNLTKVALLGTQFTMTQNFYKQRLFDAGLQVLVPDTDTQAEVHRIIYDELCQGQLLDSSQQYYRQVIKDLEAQGAEGVILGCTEIGLLISQDDSPIPVFDTTAIHAAAAVAFLLNEDTGSH